MRFGITIVIIGLLLSCNKPQPAEEEITGNWSVRWIDKGIRIEPGKEMIQYYLDGQVAFLSNGNCQMKVFGNQKCIFMKDTVAQFMKWQIKNDTLQITNAESGFKLNYQILNAEKDHFLCQLTEDVEINFTRIY